MKNLTHKDYTLERASYQLTLPLHIEILIPKDDSVRLLSQVAEELDYSELYRAYSHKGRNPAVSPKTLFKIIAYGYMNRIYTSRDLERSCQRDINFMWLLEGAKAPDHNTLARFRSKRLNDVSELLFYDLVNLLQAHNEISGKNLFVDGTKIEANANKYSFVWKKSTVKHHEKLNVKINEAIQAINQAFQLSYSSDTTLKDILDFLNEKKCKENITFVSGIGKRKGILQKSIEMLEDLSARKIKYQSYEEIFQGRNSFSKTDQDATFMRMKDDHMKNAQLKPGYNVQIGVEAEYIVGVDISQERSDSLTLIPLLERMKHHLGNNYFANIIADAGYESEENYLYLKHNKHTSYIKPANYERSKTKKHRSNRYLRENMNYDELLDEYTCPNDKKLKHIGMKTRKSKSGYKSHISVYECEDCSNCPCKAQCTKAAENRRLEVSNEFQLQREDSLKNIASEQGILLRVNRSIQVEGAFGVIKEDYGFRRFLLRGKKKVMTEILLMAIAYNINKLHNKIQSNRHGIQLHKVA